MKSKARVTASILQTALLFVLLAARFLAGTSNSYILHSLEVMIALTLIAFGESILVSVLSLPFLLGRYLKLWIRFTRYKSQARRLVAKDQSSTVIPQARS